MVAPSKARPLLVAPTLPEVRGPSASTRRGSSRGDAEPPGGPSITLHATDRLVTRAGLTHNEARWFISTLLDKIHSDPRTPSRIARYQSKGLTALPVAVNIWRTRFIFIYDFESDAILTTYPSKTTPGLKIKNPPHAFN